ncbi:DUF423 domain-containing protein [Robiginitalea marina]|uniref:DUF423 domain-containing protein n=1 Tax=Robiginitalea marina TaxID=2954105 RepID=A0ABT1AXC9_9FLAO|nr:DUF423 domain-containing protein [Robiginitalea marina]MCO5724556.1 DUF423 domain-containing protein [Robiginitalea marina]
MNKTFLGCGAALGLLAVILGALGAHALKAHLGAAALESFRTGVAYQMYHALFLLLLGGSGRLGELAGKAVGYLVLSGILLFSFSIYALTLAPLAGMDLGAIGWVTPLGGLLMISGWSLLIYRVIRSPRKQEIR